MQEYEIATISLLSEGHPKEAMNAWEEGRKRTCRDARYWGVDCLEAHLRYLSLLSPDSNLLDLADRLKMKTENGAWAC